METRLDGSKIERDKDGYPSNPRVGDKDELTCMGCQNNEEGSMVTLWDIVTWGNSEGDVGRIEEWYCDTCLMEVQASAATE